jgi:predicted NAD/FAD-dependent oxidoreductase
MPDSQRKTEILIVGAGMSGLTAATELRRAGRDVLVIDKGRGVGGRLASRRLGAATLDHGAQFITARSPRFRATIEGFLEAGVVEEWWRGQHEEGDPRPRWRGSPSMTAVAKHLARDLEVLLSTRILSLEAAQESWTARLEGGGTVHSRAVLLTPPVPQALELLVTGGVHLPEEIRPRLESIAYESCIAALAVLDGPSRVPDPGGVAPVEGHVAWIADNQKKGISQAPAVTIHATAEFSAKNWSRDRRESGRELLRAAASWLGSRVTELQVHGWLYSRAIGDQPDPCLILSQSPALVLAGDAFAGSRVEGAALSGWAAADALTSILVDAD